MHRTSIRHYQPPRSGYGRGSGQQVMSGQQLLFGRNLRAGTAAIRLSAPERNKQRAIAVFQAGGGVIRTAGDVRYWERDGQLDRADGPAIERTDGSTEWWLAGRPHRQGAQRLNGGMEPRNGIVGERHQTDGPAVEHSDGTVEWFSQGLRHHADGPAVQVAPSTRIRDSRLWAWRGQRFRRQADWQSAMEVDQL